MSRTKPENSARGLQEVVVAGQHTGFGVVDEQHVETLEDLKQRGAMVLDPIIHGVAGNELDAGHGLAHAALQNRIDVGEEEKIGVAVNLGDFGLEGREDIQFGVAGLRLVEIFEIGAFPEEALSRRALDATDIDVLARKTASSSGPKSSPTTAITRTSVKKLAAKRK